MSDRTLAIDPQDATRLVITTGYHPPDLPLLRSFPGAHWDWDRKVRTCSASAEDRARVLELAAELDLEVHPEVLAPISTPNLDAALARAEERGLYPFQLAGVSWLALHSRALLGDEMGTGKTVQALIAIPDGVPTLVIAPAAVKYNWVNECKRWRPDLKAEAVNGRRGFRFPAPGEVVVANYDILPCLTPESQLPAGLVVILDEAHLVKNYKAARTKRARAIVKRASYAWLLTGTPLLNRPFDLYGVLGSGEMDREVFGGWRGFLRDMRGVPGTWGGYEFGQPAPEVPEKLRRVMLRRKREEVLPELPSKVRQTLVVNGIDRKLKGRLEEAWGAWSEEGIDELPPFEMFSQLRAELATARIPAMLELVEQYEEQEEPVVVASAHRAPIDELHSREGWGVITGSTSPQRRAEVVEDFQAGRLKGIGITVQAGGVGITLTRASHMVMVDQDWTPANNLQAEDRICRIGATAESIQITRMVSSHRLDQHVLRLLDEKMALIEAAVDTRITVNAADRNAALREREARLLEAQEREAHLRKSKAQGKLDRVWSEGRAFLSSPRERVLTEQEKGATRGALRYLSGVCDYAQVRDNAGFNRPHAFIGHWLAEAELERESDWALAYDLCRFYRKQLEARGGFDALFGGAA